MSTGPYSRRRGAARDDRSITVLAILADREAQALLTRVLPHERVLLTSDVAEALALVTMESPGIAFVDLTIGEGAGLALIHHFKALAPGMGVIALSSPATLETAANAMALGGTGLLMLPLEGDDVLSAVSSVKASMAEAAERARLERTAAVATRAAGWMTRVVELADAPDRTVAAEKLIEIFLEATSAVGAALYLSSGEAGKDLTLAAASPSLEGAPPFGSVTMILQEFSLPKRLLVVPLALRSLAAGYILLLEATRTAEDDESRAADGLIRLLASQAAVILDRLGDRVSGALIKDPTSSAYSFAYYADVAGREIDKATRYGRRFAIVTVVMEPKDGRLPMSPAELADQLLNTMRDIDVLARVDETEFHVLMPETDGLGAHAFRRRALARLAAEGGAIPAGVLVGTAAFPHDGQNLPKLIRIARRRAEATQASVLLRLNSDQLGISDLLEALEWELATDAPPRATSAVKPLEVSSEDAIALATAAVLDARRGGEVLIVVGDHPDLSLGPAVRAALVATRNEVTVHAVDLRSVSMCEDIEALTVIAQHGAYVLLARNQDGTLRSIHAADPLLADLLAERLGRAVGLRVFG